jgi:iron complex transport system permease protein
VRLAPTATTRLSCHGAHGRLAVRPAGALTALAAITAVVFLIAVGTGAVAIAPTQVLAILASKVGLTLPWAFDDTQAAVLTAIRLPRVLLGLVIGGGLAAAGAMMQGLFRNPLADPGLIGISAGGALAATAAIVLGVGALGFLGHLALPAAAFGGGLATTFLIYRLASFGGRVAVSTMLLAGIAVNALCGAGTGLLTFMASDEQLRNITFWSLGSLGGATWTTLAIVAPAIIAPVLLAPFLSRPLNLLLLGESEAMHLGVDVNRVKHQVVLLVALSVGAAVSVAGIIGFVGLVVPHLLRLAIGPDHRLLLPASGLLGAALLVGADVAARTVVAPAELPIGIVTAVIGAPFFLWLLRSRRGEAMK